MKPELTGWTKKDKAALFIGSLSDFVDGYYKECYVSSFNHFVTRAEEITKKIIDPNLLFPTDLDVVFRSLGLDLYPLGYQNLRNSGVLVLRSDELDNLATIFREEAESLKEQKVHCTDICYELRSRVGEMRLGVFVSIFPEVKPIIPPVEKIKLNSRKDYKSFREDNLKHVIDMLDIYAKARI